MLVKTLMGLEHFEVRFFFLWGKIKLCRFFPGPLFYNITYFLVIIDKLLKGLHLAKLYNMGQNPYGRRTIEKGK